MKVQYGCECDTECMVHSEQGYSASNAPLIKIIERGGKQYKVCSRCDLSSDKLIKSLVDDNIDPLPFFEYDPIVLGSGMFDDHEGMTKLILNRKDMVSDEMSDVLKDAKNVVGKHFD